MLGLIALLVGRERRFLDALLLPPNLLSARAALLGGAQALGQKMGTIAVGHRADLVVLDGQHPLLAHVGGDDILGRWLFAGLNRMVKDVMVGGEWVVQDGRHADEIEAGRAFAAAVKAAI